MPVYRPLGLDVWMEAPADGAHELVLTVNGDEAEAGARLGFTTTGEPPAGSPEKGAGRKRRSKRK
jgi:hypothetical protein